MSNLPDWRQDMNNVISDLMSDSKSYVYTSDITSEKFPFQLLACGHFHTCEEYFVERRNFPGFLVIFTISGKGYLQYSGKKFIIMPGQLFIINCNEYHLYKAFGSCWEIKWFRFFGKASESLFNQIHPQIFDVFSINDEYLIRNIIDDIINMSQKPGTFSDIQLSAKIMSVLNYLCRMRIEMYAGIQNSIGKSLVEEAIELLRKEFKSKISINGICKNLHISTFHFSRIFKKYTGMSPHNYLAKIRINYSKELLLNSDISVGEIASKVGFENVNSFIKSFKIYTGTTPLKFKKTWTE
jgi:AraC-like DNA-binding protein